LLAIRKTGAIAVVFWSLLVLLSSISAAAVDRRDGNSWTYDVSTSVDLGGLKVSVNGTLTFKQVERRTITIDASQYDVNVMELVGELAGSEYLFGEPFISANITVGGFLYETAGGGGIVKEDVHLLTSSTQGSGGLAFSVQVETESVTTYSPPFLSIFNVRGQLGDSWSETISTRSISTTWVNGTVQSYSDNNRTLTYDMVVESSYASVETPVGAFYAKRISVTDPSGDHRIYWWSSSADNFVRLLCFHGDDTQPYMTMALKDYHYGKSGDILLFAVGLIAVVTASIVLAAVISIHGPRSRRPPPDPRSITYAHEVDNSRSTR